MLRLLAGQLARNKTASARRLALQIFDGLDALFVTPDNHVLKTLSQHGRESLLESLRSIDHITDESIDAVEARLFLPLEHDGPDSFLDPFVVLGEGLQGGDLGASFLKLLFQCLSFFRLLRPPMGILFDLSCSLGGFFFHRRHTLFHEVQRLLSLLALVLPGLQGARNLRGFSLVSRKLPLNFFPLSLTSCQLVFKVRDLIPQLDEKRFFSFDPGAEILDCLLASLPFRFLFSQVSLLEKRKLAEVCFGLLKFSDFL